MHSIKKNDNERNDLRSSGVDDWLALIKGNFLVLRTGIDCNLFFVLIPAVKWVTGQNAELNADAVVANSDRKTTIFLMLASWGGRREKSEFI